MADLQTYEGPAGGRIEVRRPLASQVGEEGQAVAAGRDPGRRGKQFPCPVRVVRSEQSHDPVQRGRSRKDSGHDAPLTRDDVAQAVQPTGRIHLRPRERRQNLPVRPQGDEHDARSVRLAGKTQTERRGGSIGAANGDGDPRREPERPGGLLSQPAGRHFRFEQGRQPFAIDLQPPADVVGPVPRSQVEQERCRGVRDVACDLARQAGAEGVLRLDYPARPGHDLGLVARDPHYLWGREADVRPVAGASHQLVARYPLLDLGSLGFGSTVRPDQGRPEGRSVRVEEDGAVHLTRHPNGRHVRAAQSGSGQQLGHRQPKRIPPAVRVLFRVARLPRFGRV